MSNRRRTTRILGSRRGGQAGFTLVELLVAMIAGLLVAAAAFAFSKSATRLFSQEARIASAQLSVLSGFERLQADIARAAYLGTPNMPRDRDFHRVCVPNDVFATWPAGMQTMAGLRITAGNATSGGAQLPDSNYPDSIRIVGSFAANDMFPVANVEAGAQGSIVTLGVNNGPLARSGVVLGDNATLQAVFATGRVLRIQDMDGNLEFGLITGATFSPTGNPQITTANAIPVKGSGESPTCGVGGYGTQSQASVLSIIEYGIVNVRGMTGGNASVYQATLFSEAGSAYGDDTRTELVRREVFLGAADPPPLSADNNVEIVAEYAVDLRFGLWVGDATSTPAGLTYLAPSTAAVYQRTTLANNYVEGTLPTGPESIRAVEVRLAVRSREVDRNAMIDPTLTGTSADGGFMYRFPLPNDAGVARARTLVATVSLDNQRGDTWQ